MIRAAAVILVSLAGVLSVKAQAELDYSVDDEITQPPFKSSFSVNLTTTVDATEGRVWFSSSKKTGKPSVKRDAMIYHFDSASGWIPLNDYEAFMDKVSKLALEDLTKEKGESDGFLTSGSLGMKRSSPSDTLTAGPNDPVRKELEKLIQQLVEEHRPFEEEAHRDLVVEGETVAARKVAFADLVRDPQTFNGKRVRVTGYYHNEFEGSSFMESSESVRYGNRVIWLDGPSENADPNKIDPTNDAYLTVEGVFSAEDKGHMGMFAGSLQECTLIQKADRTPKASKPKKGKKSK